MVDGDASSSVDAPAAAGGDGALPVSPAGGSDGRWRERARARGWDLMRRRAAEGGGCWRGERTGKVACVGELGGELRRGDGGVSSSRRAHEQTSKSMPTGCS